MLSKSSLKQALFVVGIIGLVISSVTILHLPTFNSRERSASLVREDANKNQFDANLAATLRSAVFGEQTKRGLPTRLKIPKINVDAVVEYVGLTPEGTMDAPKNPVNVAWLDLVARPGEVGSAVIAGHEGWKNGIPAVFDDLNKLKEEDEISVEDENGITTTFVVREIRIYKEGGDPSDVFASNDGKAHLNLITCAGDWDKVKKGYPERLVVFTDKE